ncbi:MAG: KH domain-containing protein [Candidatus Methanospirareceae archaeon]
MYEQHIKIPHDRIGVIIGHNGATKEYLEERTNSKIRVDSKEGDVYIEGEDALKVLRALEVVRAIGRGFSPEKAFKLLDDDSLLLEIMSLSHLQPKALRRIKGRIIGKNGKTRRIIEELASVWVSVYGKTVGIIGYPSNIKIAHSAIEMLINGAPHSAVYSFLERKRRELREKEMLWE